MTTANKITIVRILMIPVFGAAAFCNSGVPVGPYG
jgi:phosphatidylglycerophosphate synthase